MIVKLRKQFILVAMCSIFSVWFVIIATMNILYYQNVKKDADHLLTILAENNGRFPGNAGNTKKNYLEQLQGNTSEKQGIPSLFSPETPFETRYFSVHYTSDGKVEYVDTGKIMAVLTKDAMRYAEEVRSLKKEKGFYSQYRYLVIDNGNKCMVLFLDVSRGLRSFQSILTTSVIVSVLGLLAVFILVIVFSRWVFRPVAASVEKQKRFITDASHELKTPLTIISANVEVLEMEMEEENNWTKSIKNQVERMNALVVQMVKLSRLDEEAVLLDMENFSLTQSIYEVVESFRPVAVNQNLEFLVDVKEGLICHGDKKQIVQMLSLLLDNAMKYTNTEGSISISAAKSGKRNEIVLTNTVEEIKKGNLNVLFERFYRLDASRNSEVGGSGIGLSIVKSIVEAHKGKINAVSRDGKSVQFTILL